MQYNNTNIRRRNPITRNTMFFSPEDFQFEMDLGREYVEEDMGQKVILYEVDLDKTKVDDIYKESAKDEIHFKPPVELPVVYELEEAELKSYEKKQNKGVYLQTGKLTFGVYEQTLEENECDIKRGDYIGVQVTEEHIEFFTVIDDGRNNFANKMTLYGTRPFYRRIKCASVDAEEFNG